MTYPITRRGFLAAASAAAAASGLAACGIDRGDPGQGPGQGPENNAPPANGSKEVAPGVKRKDCLILENPTGRIAPADDFNRWRPGFTGASTGLQQIALDALWYIDPDAGVNGVWDNACAAEKPIYNSDFTQMTVKLRKGLMWSDGVEFTADDLHYTVDVQMKNDGWAYTGQFQGNVESMEMPDDYTVVFNLKGPNSRFHTYFTVRWAACFMMPKHVFEAESNPLEFRFDPPVSLSAYTLKEFDPNGDWYLWEKRKDWDKTSMGLIGEPGPPYAMYIAPGPSDKRVIAQIQKNLDVIHDLAPEGRIQLAEKNPTSLGWFKDFPWAHPDPTLPAVLLNNEKPGLDKKQVRWALALAIDIVRVSMASYRGAATISALHVPPTGLYPKYYHDPMDPWLREFTIDVGGSAYAPFDPEACNRIAEEARKTLGDLVPTDPEQIKASLGRGWWKYDLETAEKLMVAAGMQRKGDTWTLPNGEPFEVPVVSAAESNPTMNRAASMVVECWKEFGVQTRHVATDDAGDMTALGDFSAAIGWTIETWGGHPDLFYFLQSWHSQFYVESGKRAVGKNFMRWRNPELDRIIVQIQNSDFDDPAATELGIDFLELATAEMPTIPLMSYNVFTVCDNTFFEGFPTSEDPYTNPVPNWGNTKYMFTRVKPKG